MPQEFKEYDVVIVDYKDGRPAHFGVLTRHYSSGIWCVRVLTRNEVGTPIFVRWFITSKYMKHTTPEQKVEFEMITI